MSERRPEVLRAKVLNDDPVSRFLSLWRRLLWWERRLLAWFAYLSLGKRTIFPALAGQAGIVGLVMVLTPGNPLVWGLVATVALVYSLMFQALIKK